MPDLSEVLKQLKEERTKLDGAIRTIEGLSGLKSLRKTRGRTMAPEARRKIALAQKKRWATWRKGKKAA